MSVLNLLVRRHPGYSEPVKSKEDVVVHCGFRRFRASPLYSQHTSGGAAVSSAPPRGGGAPTGSSLKGERWEPLWGASLLLSGLWAEETGKMVQAGRQAGLGGIPSFCLREF
uniref:Pre-rRNA-processing protein TSR1 homolog n=1 Tax=Micrurus corallinus TaxID=54390 RepID=A0A2D4FBA1_MICCO